MRHSSDKQLQALLLDDEDALSSGAVAKHVEQCARCRERMDKLSGCLVGADGWTSRLIDHLKTLDTTKLDSEEGPSLTNVERQASHSESDEIELDPITLDFLEPGVHPELLGRLGRYDIERVIGSGGMGMVLKGHDGELHRSVAIKVLAPHLAHSAAARRRFAREAQAAAAIHHPHVIPIFNVESDGKLPYLVMQYIAGPSLQQRVDAEGPLSVLEVLRIAQQTAAGLAAAHAQGLIHRDVKPANILLGESVDSAILSDFGLARTVDDASLTRSGIVTGTPHYMSPEQAVGEAIDYRSDQFSLGCVIYFMLTGRPPFRASTAMGVLNRICHHEHRPISETNSEVPKELSELVDRLLAKSASKRFAKCALVEEELSNLLLAFQSGQLSVRPNRVCFTRSMLTRKRRLIAAIMLAVVCLIFASVAVFGPVRGSRRFNPSEAVMQQLMQPQIGNFSSLQASPAADLFNATLFQRSEVDPWRQQLGTVDVELRQLELASLGNSMLPWIAMMTASEDVEIAAMMQDIQRLEQMIDRRVPSSFEQR